jgi:hypothetical protein
MSVYGMMQLDFMVVVGGRRGRRRMGVVGRSQTMRPDCEYGSEPNRDSSVHLRITIPTRVTFNLANDFETDVFGGYF